jgi:hypothetical protein
MRMSLEKFDNNRIRLFCSLALPIILLMQISLPGIAMCFGLDGHVELETYTEGLCNEGNTVTESQKSARILRSLTNSSTQHCGVCIDIPTADKNSEHKALSSNDLMPAIDIHALAAYQYTPEASLDTLGQSFFIVEDFPVYRSFLHSLQTTVITC